MTRFIKILFISLAIVLVGVTIYFIFVQKTPNVTPLKSSTTSLQDLRAAPEKVVIQDSEYALETYLWRDFMPISPPDGKPLIASVKVKPRVEITGTSKIGVTRLWVIKGEEIWETEFTDEESATALEKVGRGGPKWGPGITVDVVVRVIDLKSDEEYLLKASKQEIRGTY